MASIEEKVEDAYKAELDRLKIKRFSKTESINSEIKTALENADSKSGGSGGNFPDIQVYLDDRHGRRIPVMMECKGTKGKLEKFDKDGTLATDNRAVQGYAVNGAIHYGQALVNGIEDLSEVIVIGMNGSQLDSDDNVKDLVCKAYYLSQDNGYVPKHIDALDNDLTLFADRNIPNLYKILDTLSLTQEEHEQAKRKTEEQLESAVMKMHQSLYDNDDLKRVLSTNEKLYLFCGLIMAGLPTEGVASLTANDFHGNNDRTDNDGQVVLRRIKAFLQKRNYSDEKIKMVLNLLRPVFEKPSLWKPKYGVSLLKALYLQIKHEIIPLLDSPFHLDFMGKIFNNLSDWVHIENDSENDVVLTPRYITSFMARLCQTDMNSMVWDRAMGSGGFLVAAMDIMIRDARSRIKDKDKLDAKISNIKENQLLGVEILDSVFILAILNMILMGDGSSNLYFEDSHKFKKQFPATVFLLNPPYSAEGKGLIFVEEALSQMTTGYAAVLIQENAGSTQGESYGKRILEKNSLIASIHMPGKLFSGKSSVQTAIYVFRVNEPHDKDKLVKFIDFSDDGYARQSKRKATQAVNLRDVDNATARYDEVEALVLGKKPKTNFYTKENGLLVEDVISLEGNDWTFAQHQVIDPYPVKKDFEETVSAYLAWKFATNFRNEVL